MNEDDLQRELQDLVDKATDPELKQKAEKWQARFLESRRERQETVERILADQKRREADDAAHSARLRSLLNQRVAITQAANDDLLAAMEEQNGLLERIVNRAR